VEVDIFLAVDIFCVEGVGADATAAAAAAASLLRR